MNDNALVTTGFDMHRPFNDLGLVFAKLPLYRIRFDMEDAAIEQLAQRFSGQVYRSYRRVKSNKLELMTLVLRFDDETFVIATDGYSGDVCAASAERAEAIYRQLEPVLKECALATKPAFHMLRYESGEISAEQVTDTPPALSTDLIRLYYGPDIDEWLQGFEQRTRTKVGGITILEGAPGTGKTTLIWQLVTRLSASHMFYVLPVGNDAALTAPELVPFWIDQNEQHPNKIKVIVLEDSDRILLRRGSENQNSISALLNIADGLMGHMLKLHLVCSLDGRLDEIDPAILRPGRLLNHRQFGRLSIEKARTIARMRGVNFNPPIQQESYTLAEILNPSVIEQPSPDLRMGF